MFKNHQWAVTTFGLESILPDAPLEYLIEARRLLEDKGKGQGRLYDWPLHIAEKNWVDIEAFIEAYEAAIEEHAGKYPGIVDQTKIEESNNAARSKVRRPSSD